MWAKRAQEFQAKINSGDLKAVAEVCRDLQSAANGSAPSYSQRNLFELAIDRLAGEFAGVVGTDKADAIVKLTQKLVDGRTADTAQVRPTGRSGAGKRPRRNRPKPRYQLAARVRIEAAYRAHPGNRFVLRHAEGDAREGIMVFKPNYNQQRAERDRAKQAKKEAKLREREDAALARRPKAEQDGTAPADAEVRGNKRVGRDTGTP